MAGDENKGDEVSKRTLNTSLVCDWTFKGAGPWGSFTLGWHVTAYVLKGQRYPAGSLRAVLVGLCARLFEYHPNEFARVSRLRGRDRKYFTLQKQDLHDPQEIPAAGWYVEGGLSGNAVRDLCHQLLDLFGHLQIEFFVELEKGSDQLDNLVRI